MTFLKSLRISRTTIVLFCALLMPSLVKAQGDPIVDSLRNIVNNNPRDTAYVDALGALFMQVIYSDDSEADSLVNEIFLLSEELEYKRGTSIGHHHRGVYYFVVEEDYDNAITQFEHALKLREEVGDGPLTMQALQNIANGYLMKEEYDEALSYYFKAKPYLDAMPEGRKKVQQLRTAHLNTGLIYMRQEAWSKAKENHRIALELSEQDGDLRTAAKALNYLGLCLDHQDSAQASLAYYNRSMAISDSLNDLYNLTELYNNMGNAYTSLKDYEKSIEFHRKSMEIDSVLESLSGISASLLNISGALIHLGRHQEALATTQQSLELAISSGVDWMQGEIYSVMSEAYAGLGQHKKAYETQELSIAYLDTLNTGRNEELLAELDGKYQHAKQQNEINQLKKDQALDEARKLVEDEQEAARWTLVYWGIGFGVIVLIMITVGLIQKARSNNRLKEQQQVIEAKNVDLESANKQITGQRDEIEEKNQDILSSIRYAQRIQNAILPHSDELAAALPNAFVLYRPKDIVSGDFYWLKQKNGRSLFAAVDCTGHGVPGAFVSMLGFNGLNSAVDEHDLQQPASILDKLNLSVTETFQRETSAEQDLKDGMDIALCSINYSDLTLEYAGANNSLYIVSNNDVEEQVDDNAVVSTQDSTLRLTEVKADKQAIGGGQNAKTFSNHKIQLQKGQTIYVFSDGFIDQFGGEKGKKLKSRPFKQLLLSLQEHSMEEQGKLLGKAFDKWKGNLEQLDDVCVVGVRI